MYVGTSISGSAISDLVHVVYSSFTGRKMCYNYPIMVVELCQLFRWSISCVPLLISSSFVALSLVGLLVVSTAYVFPATTFGFFVAGVELDRLAVLRERSPARPFALSCFCRGFISHCVGYIHSLWILLFRFHVPLSSHSFASSTLGLYGRLVT